MKKSVKDILNRLSDANHRGGAFSSSVLMAIAEVLPTGKLMTLETGCGKSTIMFSNLAEKHYVFTYDDRESEESSVLMVQNDNEFRKDHTVFIYGPTQKTLRNHEFYEDDIFDVILLDGPHGYPFPDLEYALLYERLKEGGILIIDDIHIPSIGRMYDILREDRMYEEVGVFSTTGLLKRTAIEGVPFDGDHWYEQSYNYSRFPLPMEKYQIDRTIPLNIPISLAEPRNLFRYAIKSIEHSPGNSAAQTTDIGATLEFEIPDSTETCLNLEIEYKSIYEDASQGAIVLIEGASVPLTYTTDWSRLEIQIERPESGRIIVTFVHPSARTEHDREEKRYEFRRLGSLVRSIILKSKYSIDQKQEGESSALNLYKSYPQGSIVEAGSRSFTQVRPENQHRKKRVCYISHVHFWYRSNGGMERDMRMLSYLSRHFELKMVYLGYLTEQDIKAIDRLDLEFEIHDIGTGQEKSREDWITQFMKQKPEISRADVYILRALENEYMLDALPEGAKTFLDSMDLVSERSQKGGAEDNILSKISQEQEIESFRRFNQIICIQEEEAKLVAQWIGEEHVVTAKHPVDPSASCPERDRYRIGLIASRWAPNAYGLRDFIKNCWPTLRRRGATLDVYGNVIEVLNASIPAVTFHGYVERIEDCYANLGIIINPVQYGAGLKIKSIEALAQGLPLVTTREGASGIEHLDGTALVIADSWDQFTEQLSSLMEDEDRCRSMSESALIWVTNHLNEEACFDDLRMRIESA